jgi:serine/threonine protein kinase
MPSHILTVYRRSNPSKKFIAKKIHEDSDELDILRHLNTSQLKSEHIISLHDSFQTQSTSWAILPKMISLPGGRLHGIVDQVCWGLINGVPYLHKFYIAHGDIKPDNLVVDRNFCLKIIDFDVAMQVEDEDELVEGQRGTKGWMAPEIEEKSMYSPIKADRWSTGKVLLYLLEKFREEDMVLETTARRLIVHNPGQRLSMLRVAASPSNVVDVADVAVGKKALRSPTADVDVENMKPPMVKMQKLAAANRRKRGARVRRADSARLTFRIFFSCLSATQDKNFPISDGPSRALSGLGPAMVLYSCATCSMYNTKSHCIGFCTGNPHVAAPT